MGFNYAAEKAKFEAEWRRTSAEFAQAGMSEKDIQSMRDFDWETFCADRIWANHNQPLPDTYLLDGEQSTLFRKYETMSATFDEKDFTARYAWVETISDPDLAVRMKKLSDRDLELLTFIVIEGHS